MTTKRLFDHSDRGRLLRKDKEGVASTVGTIMALMVFMAFMGLFVNSYIPVWMEENEEAHMNDVMNQFGDMKGSVDNLMVSASVTGSTSFVVYSPFTLGSDGVPLFAAQTAGAMALTPKGMGNSSIQVTYAGGTGLDETGGGRLQFYAPNRYYVQQMVAYENGALMIKQEDGQSVRAEPNIQVEQIGSTGLHVTIDMVDILGSNETLAGLSTLGINIELLYQDARVFESETGESLTISLVTQYASAWAQYFNNLTEEKQLDDSDYSATLTVDGEDVTYVIDDVRRLTFMRSYLSMEMVM